MQTRGAVPISLLKLPLKIRLLIIVASFPVGLGLNMLIYPTTRNGTAIIIPALCAALFFGYLGAFVGMAISASIATYINLMILHQQPLDPANLLTTIFGTFTGLVICTIVSYLRYALITIERERMQKEQAEQERALAHAQRIEALQAEQQITIAYEQQRHLHQLKDQFILNVNHELRTPLTEVYGYLDLLSTYHERLDPELQTTFLHRALEGCEELMQLINNVLDSINLHSDVKPPLLEKVVIRPLVQRVLDSFDPRLKDAFSIMIEVPPQLSAWADQHYLRQILRNLLSNAFKYSPEHTNISIRSVENDEEKVCLCVQDTGPGIPPEEIPHIFERFVRLKRDLSGSVRGTGLGLYISKQLVEAMGGKLWAESSGLSGEGSCFYFLLYDSSGPPPPMLEAASAEPSALQGDGEHVMSLLTGMDQGRDE